MMAAVASGRSSWQSWPLFVAVLLFSVLAASFANAQPTYGYDGPSSIYNGPVNVARGEVVTVGSDAISLVSGVDRDSGIVYDSPQYRYATNTPANTLYHYTDEAGQAGIVSSGELRPSLASVNPSDVRYGNGQYLSDIVPGTQSCAQLSRCFLGQPFQGQRFTHYVEIDVSGLNVIKGRPGVFVIPGDEPLDLLGRMVGVGGN